MFASYLYITNTNYFFGLNFFYLLDVDMYEAIFNECRKLYSEHGETENITSTSHQMQNIQGPKIAKGGPFYFDVHEPENLTMKIQRNMLYEKQNLAFANVRIRKISGIILPNT
ncbi:hypothetical protein ACJX0J_012350 [Zea mays]